MLHAFKPKEVKELPGDLWAKMQRVRDVRVNQSQLVGGLPTLKPDSTDSEEFALSSNSMSWENGEWTEPRRMDDSRGLRRCQIIGPCQHLSETLMQCRALSVQSPVRLELVPDCACPTPKRTFFNTFAPDLHRSIAH